jgi:hypothetical protein
MGGATGARGDHGGAGAGAAGDAVDAGGVKGFGQRHGRQDGGEPTGQHRLPRPRGAEHETLWSERQHHLYYRLCADSGLTG